MRFSLLFFALCLAFTPLSAQAPLNDNCDGIIDLGVAPYCPDISVPDNFSEIYTNLEATASDIGFGNNPSCFSGGTAQRDVWFSFTTSDTILDYTITVMGVGGVNGENPILNPQVALYRGACAVDNLAELLCASAAPGENMVILNAEGLTPNITYYLRINDYSGSAASNAGSFKLCVDEKDPINLITDGESSSCTGLLFDSGGPDGDYGNNENNVFTICPDDLNQCIVFSLEYYNLEFGDFMVTDQLLFFDGPTNDQNTLITTLGGFDFSTFNQSASSGVCYEVQASSGCMTIQFISDGSSTFSGFAGSWECSTTACEINESIDVNLDPDEAAIEAAITTPLALATVTDIDCEDVAFATFTAGDNTDLGLGKGLFMSSGEAAYAIGPNNSAGGDNIFTADHGRDGDDDLDALSFLSGSNILSQDACIIELDVLANTNELSFEYIFGSEEYPEFINQDYNDIFAFLISGDGIAGLPELDNQENIAVLPGTNTFVEINSVNHLQNWEYYRNNENGVSVEYDGLTSDFLGSKKSLTARATVTPCETYHLKLAIADRGDGIYDSGVFISELTGGTPQIEVVFNSGIDYLIEQCTNETDEVIIRLDNPEDIPVTYNVIIGGTATIDEDYLLNIPDQITFDPGVNEINFPIEVLNDLEDMEGVETITIALTNDFGCGIVELASVEIELFDQFMVDINNGQDTVRVCTGSGTQLIVEGAANYFWSPVGVFDDPSISDPVATVSENGWVYVEGTIGLDCSATDSIYIQLVDPTVTIMEENVAICQGESVIVTAENFNNDQGISWFPEEGVSDPNAAMVTLTPEVSTQYIVSLDTGLGCMTMDTIFIDVGAFDHPDVIDNTTICQNFGITLAQFTPPPTPTTTYEWTPQEAFTNPNSPTPTVFPDETTTYQLISTSNNGACSETSTVTISVLPADVEISPETIAICQGGEVLLSATTSTGLADNLIWSPDDGSLSATSGLNVTALPFESTTYLATFTVGSCTVVDSILVQVDSLPADMTITAEPFEDPFCQGEIVTLTSPDYDAPTYPLISHNWVGIGLLSSDTLYNLVFSAIEPFTYQRTTTNGSCSQVEEIMINVITDEGVTASPLDAFICPGDGVQLMANSEQGGEISWSPSESLSCDDCLDPIATPSTTTIYAPSFNVEGCIIQTNLTVTVGEEPDINLISDQIVCPGDQVDLTQGTEQAGVSYNWTSSNDSVILSNMYELSITANQTQTYTLVASNECYPATTSSVTITVAEQLQVLNIGDDQTICSGEPFNLAAEIGGTPSTSDNFSWSYDGEMISDLNAQFMATNTGFAVFSYTYGPDCGTSVDSVLITVEETPLINLVADAEFCLADVPALTLNTASAQPGVTYSWSSPDDPGFSNNDPELIVNPSATTTYVLSASTEACTLSQEVTVTVIQPAELTATDFVVFSPQITMADLEANVSGGGGEESFLWTVEGNVIGDRSIIFNYSPSFDSLPNIAVVTYTNACETLIDSTFLQVLDYRIPNVFSPNGDGTNDVFKPFYIGQFDIVELVVYNRWGQEIFSSSNPNNPGWDGMVNDKPAPSDVYIYRVVVGLAGETLEEEGQITLIR